MRKVKFSVIVPVVKINDYLRQEIIPALEKQTFKSFELIIVPDKKGEKENFPAFVKIFPSWPKLGPADKKDLGARKAGGEILAFLDDDAYPHKNWLKNAQRALDFYRSKSLSFSPLAAVCGPGVTPANDSLLAQVSGWFWSSWLGAGGAGTYRCWPQKAREVDDYPTFNLLIRKKDFQKAGGFNSRFWPGEDTKLCHDLIYKLGKKIIYNPKVLVFHHRRPIFKPHLRQIGRYGLHRGFFVKILPKTSKRPGYFLPSLFFLGVFGGLLFGLFSKTIFNFYLIILGVYFCLNLITAVLVFFKSKNILIALLLVPTIFVSHLYYGWRFLKGLLKKKLTSRYQRI